MSSQNLDNRKETTPPIAVNVNIHIAF